MKKETEKELKRSNKLWPPYRWGMVIDLDKCSGCQACIVACKAENNVPFESKEPSHKDREMTWIRIKPTYDGKYPTIKNSFIPIPCMHCENPPCIRVCPVGATYYSKDTGIVGQIYGRCIGCRYCTVACPYTVRVFNWYPPNWPSQMKRYLNPDVSVRPRGVVEKCTFCSHRLNAAKNKAREENRQLRDGDYLPACVENCPTNAMYFGDFLNKDSVVYKLKKDPRAYKLMDDLGTEPKVIYLRKV